MQQNNYILLFFIFCTLSVQAKREVTFAILKQDTTYTFSLKPQTPNFFTLPKGALAASEFLKQFLKDNQTTFVFDSQRMPKKASSAKISSPAAVPGQEDVAPMMGQEEEPKQAKTTVSYADAIDVLANDPKEAQALAQALLKRQAYATQMYQYFMNGEVVAKMQSLLRVALNKLDETVRKGCIDKFKQLTIQQITIDLDDRTTFPPFFALIYNAIQTFGTVIGFDMPSLEPWYVRHRGKLILGAATGLALFAVARSANLFGTATPAAPAQQPVLTSPVEPTLFGSLQSRIYKAGTDFAQRQAGYVGKSIVESLGREPGQQGSGPYDIAAKQIIEHLAIKQGIIPAPAVPTAAQQATAAGAKLFYEAQGQAWRDWTPGAKPAATATPPVK